MVCCIFCPALLIEHLSKTCYSRSSLLIAHGRRKVIVHLYVLIDIIPEHIHSVSKENHPAAELIDFVNYLFYHHYALRQNGIHPAIGKIIQPCIGLLSSCIHKRTHNICTAPQIVCKCIYSRHRNYLLIQCHCKPLRRRRAYAKPCERSRSC